MPYCHRNAVKFVGMSNKENYLIWREKNGFFSALSKIDMALRTWSMSTGDLLYAKKIDQSLINLNLNEFEIFQDNSSDKIWRSGF